MLQSAQINDTFSFGCCRHNRRPECLHRLKHHLFSRFKIGDGPNCPCGASRQDAQHILQDCPQLEEARRKYWPEPKEMNQKLYGSAIHLGITAEFINSLDLTI
ncbi:hypothetical protein RRG08_018117 [Elysia crispata]|uniref:Uncharacterized protein n=1 Tax=Elysia crispata TaxID=231223 RepID=A0AAE1DES7_9GAST|nr:hypothetical protein RRG08_018117 [Elysia crispata]